MPNLHSQGKIAYFKIPKQIWLVERLSLTVIGKPQELHMRKITIKN